MSWATVVAEPAAIPSESNVAIWVAAITATGALAVAWVAQRRATRRADAQDLDHGRVQTQILDLHADFRDMASHLMRHIAVEDNRDYLTVSEIEALRQIQTELHTHITGMDDRRSLLITEMRAVIEEALQAWRREAAEQGWDGIDRRQS